uniref:Primary ciliary dyskinesia protein 1 n=1 Tax=Lygus hesperus TaxID=30085 RepID=A0A0A9X862_LYGHE
MNFGHVPLGQKRVRKIVLRPLKSDMPYIFMCGGSNQDLVITPTRGVVRTGGPPAEISISYKPTAYITLHAEVSLYLPSVIFNPYVFTVTAYTEPGFARTEVLKKPSDEKMIINPLREKVFTHPTWLLKQPKFILPKKTLPIWSQHKSNKLLFKQMKVKRSPFELLGPLGRHLDEEESIVKAKEQKFFEGVTLVHRQNYLAPYHTRTKLRPVDTPVLDRGPLWSEYMKQYDIPTYNNHGEPLYIRQRTVKWMELENKLHRFTDRLPNIWFPRYVTMGKFIEAGRRIIHKNRLMKVLKKLRQLTKEKVVAFETPPVEPF